MSKLTRSGLWSRVRFRDAEGEEAYTIVGPEEADYAAGRISADSPLGRGLLGRSAGEELGIRTPGGLRRVRVLGVDEEGEG